MHPFHRGLAIGLAGVTAVAAPPNAITGPANADPALIDLESDASGDVTITSPGHYVDTDGDTFRSVSIASDGVTLDGLTFDGTGTAGAGVATQGRACRTSPS